MYLDFFSLKKFPFRITPDPSMFYPGRTDGPGVILNALVYAITSGEGIVKVVGEVGSGKTMLCRMLEERLPEAVEIVYLANPRLSARDIIYAIAFELHLDVDAGTERLLVMQKLQDYLLKKHAEGGSVVVFIEEAQGMPIETLEEIRLLSNLETHQHKLMQIVLFGQPELDKNLEDRSIRQLRERITHSFYLTPMSLEATRDYIRYRLQAAGCPWPRVFSPKAEKMLARAAGGLTRRINILADKSLMAAYANSPIQAGQEYGALQQTVLPKHVRAAIRDSNYRSRMPAWSLPAFVVLVLALGAIFWLRPGERVQLPLLAATQTAAAPVTATPVADVPLQAAAAAPTDEAEAVSEPEVSAAAGQEVIAPAEPTPQAATETLSVVSVDAAMQMAGVPAGEVLAENAETDPGADIETSVETVETIVGTASEPPGEPTVAQPGGSRPTVEAAPAAASQAGTEEPGPVAEAAPFTPAPAESNPVTEVAGGLIALRDRASENWLQRPDLAAYTVQLAAFSLDDNLQLEEFLQLLSQANLLANTYLCRISATAVRPSQWLVFQGDFAGVTLARNHIDALPVYSRRYGPFVRNTSNIACL